MIYMQYKAFGRTGIRLSRLGFGAMRLPMVGENVDKARAVEAIMRAYELGVNYFDTGYYYCNKQSEEIVGGALREVRDKVYLSTKNPIEDSSGKNWRSRLERSLKLMGVDHIDFYQAMWGASWAEYQEKFACPGGGLEEALKAKEEGLIGHICCSFHDSVDNLIKLMDTGVFEGITLQYNMLDRSLEQGIDYASQKGIGIVVMGPVGGGRLAAPAPEILKLIPGGSKSSAEVALRFVLSNKGVTTALSGMSTMQMVEENAAVAGRTDPLTEAERIQILEVLDEKKRLSDLYCTGCGYCMPCPNGVDIPENFQLMNSYRIYGLKDHAREGYRELGEREKDGKIVPAWAEACKECGKCEPKCPQNIPIVRQLKETKATLG